MVVARRNLAAAFVMIIVSSRNSCDRVGSGAGLEQRRNLSLRELRCDVIEEWHVREGDPATLRSRVNVEVLVLDATRLDRQQQEIAGLPIDPFAVNNGIALA